MPKGGTKPAFVRQPCKARAKETQRRNTTLTGRYFFYDRGQSRPTHLFTHKPGKIFFGLPKRRNNLPRTEKCVGQLTRQVAPESTALALEPLAEASDWLRGQDRSRQPRHLAVDVLRHLQLCDRARVSGWKSVAVSGQILFIHHRLNFPRMFYPRCHLVLLFGSPGDSRY